MTRIQREIINSSLKRSRHMWTSLSFTFQNRTTTLCTLTTQTTWRFDSQRPNLYQQCCNLWEQPLACLQSKSSSIINSSKTSTIIIFFKYIFVVRLSHQKASDKILRLDSSLIWTLNWLPSCKRQWVVRSDVPTQ